MLNWRGCWCNSFPERANMMVPEKAFRKRTAISYFLGAMVSGTRLTHTKSYIKLFSSYKDKDSYKSQEKAAANSGGAHFELKDAGAVTLHQGGQSSNSAYWSFKC